MPNAILNVGSTGGQINISTAAAPATPAVGKVTLYAGTDKALHALNSDGTDITIAAASAASPITVQQTCSLVSTAIGATATSNCAVVIGNAASSTAAQTVAIGDAACTTNQQAVAIGDCACSAAFAVAIGHNARATNELVVALGYQAISSGDRAIAIGYASSNSAPCGIAIGTASNNSGCGSVSIGSGSNTVDGVFSVGLGNANCVQPSCSVAIGTSNRTFPGATGTIVLGNSSIGGTGACNSVVIGNSAKTTAACSIVIGQASSATCANGVALGNLACVTSPGGVAIGTNVCALGSTPSVAIGCNICITGSDGYAIAVGRDLSSGAGGLSTRPSVLFGNNMSGNGSFGSVIGFGSLNTLAFGSQVFGLCNNVGEGSLGVGSSNTLGGNNNDVFGISICLFTATDVSAIGRNITSRSTCSAIFGRGNTIQNCVSAGTKNTIIGLDNTNPSNVTSPFSNNTVVGNTNVLCGNNFSNTTLGHCNTISSNLTGTIGICNTVGHTGASVIGNQITTERANTVHLNSLIAYGQAASKTNVIGSTGGTTTINWDNSNIQTLTLTSNITTLTKSNPIDGAVYTLFLTQGASGAYTVAWGADVKWPAGTAPTLSTAAGATDTVSLVYVAGVTGYYGNANLNFS